MMIIITGCSPESPYVRHNIELEHLQKRDNHNSAFPQRSMIAIIIAIAIINNSNSYNNSYYQ